MSCQKLSQKLSHVLLLTQRKPSSRPPFIITTIQGTGALGKPSAHWQIIRSYQKIPSFSHAITRRLILVSEVPSKAHEDIFIHDRHRDTQSKQETVGKEAMPLLGEAMSTIIMVVLLCVIVLNGYIHYL
jgi:hypothetical protein